MMSFFSSLINRHTLMDNVVKPRFTTIFEAENFSSNSRNFNETFNGDFTHKKAAADNQSDSPVENDVLTVDTNIPIDKIEQALLHINSKRTKRQDNKQVLNPVTTLAPGGMLADARVPWLPALPQKTVKPGTHKNSETVNPIYTISLAGEVVTKGTHFPVEVAKAQFQQTLVNTPDETLTGELNESLTNTPAETPKRDTENDANSPVHTLNTEREYDDSIIKRSAFSIQDQGQSSYFTKSLSLKNISPTQTPKATIKVTIGQIDVKAITDVQPFAAVKTKKAEAPRMSLDDYLKMRDSN
ncbi:MAG: hypothetical protein EOP46_04325 [Sphingobacteriaceae bacterium]|nr:MAG: hypothetical protein EOP46_04325 [Sphingobacteriaceae bacterium]